MARGIKGKVAVVTGGASGIGKATALALAREGAKLVIATGRSVAAAKEVVGQIEGLGGEAIYVQCDVTDEAQVEAMVAKTVERFGRLDIGFNNAGVGPDGVTIPCVPIVDLAEADWDKVVDTNLKGVFLCMKHELRQMHMQGSGNIVNTSSTAALGAKPAFGAYCPSKAGVVMVSKVAALENKGLGIRVNVVCPGPTRDTGMSDRLLSSMADATAGETAPGAPKGGEDLLSVMGEPDDVARVVVWLCSDEASFVTGNVLAVDGGLDIS